MRSRIHDKKVHNLSRDEVVILRRLTKGSEGEMSQELTRQLADPYSEARAIYLKKDGIIQGWTLVWWPYMYEQDPREPRYKDRAWTYTYVPKDRRRRGIGTRVMKQALKYEKNPRVDRWNTAATGFFDSVDKFRKRVK